jgi:hypothetical protein
LPGGALHPNIVFLEKGDEKPDVTAAPMFVTVSTSTPSVCCNGEFLIVSGGYDRSTARSVATIQIYDANRKIWSELPDLPHPVHWHGTTIHNNSIYSIGGKYRENGQDQHRYDTIHSYCMRSGKWTDCGARLPSAVQEPGIATVEDDIVIVGGVTDSGLTSDTCRLNVKDNRIVRCQPMPKAAIVYRSTVAVNRQVYVLAPIQFLCYDLLADTWVRFALPMKPCFNVAMVCQQHRLVAMGGYYDDLENPNDRVQVYDLNAKKWEAQKNMDRKLTYHWAVVMKV